VSEHWRAKETLEIDLNQLIEVPTTGGGTVRKRLVELTAEDVRALGERHRAAEVEADRLGRERAAERRGGQGLSSMG
jgi:hypothetical protein